MNTTDELRIKRILDPLFLSSPVKIMGQNESAMNVEIQAAQNIAIHVIHALNKAQSYILMAEHNGYDFFLKCDTIEHKGEGSLLKPVRAIIKPSLRREERHVLNPDEKDVLSFSKPMLYTEFLSSFDVLNVKRDRQVKIQTAAIHEILPDNVNVTFTFRKSAHMNLRMRTLANQRLPILAPDKNNPLSWYAGDDFSFLSYIEYGNIMRSENWTKVFASEICVPLRYHDETTFGYIHVTSIDQLELEHYKVVAHLGRQFEKIIQEQDSFAISKANCEIIDISRHGLAFFHPKDKEVFQKYQNGETLIFNLKFPAKELISFTAKIRSGLHQGDKIRFGLEFIGNNSVQQDALDTYVTNN